MRRIREEVLRSLARHDCGVLSIAALPGVSAVPVRYQRDGLSLRCHVPRWSDVAHLLTEEPDVLLVVADLAGFEGRWLSYRASGHLQGGTEDGRFATAVLLPRRIDLVDESLRWGVLDTLEP